MSSETDTDTMFRLPVRSSPASISLPKGRRSTCRRDWTILTQSRSDADLLILRSIREKRLIRFVMDGGERVAEPHDYGIRKGEPTLLVWQIAGASRSGKLPDWRWIQLAKASNFALLDETFAGGRGISHPKHTNWDPLWARGEPAATTAPRNSHAD